MSLAAVKTDSISQHETYALVPMELESLLPRLQGEPYIREWFEQPASQITHHDADCCKEARAWFRSYAVSMQASHAAEADSIRAPTWLSQRFTWGPSRWPIAWCEVIQQKVIDCGVFAALARECFELSGHAAHPGQILLDYSVECTSHWNTYWGKGADQIRKKRNSKWNWTKEPLKFFPWIGNHLVYHEICLVELGEGRTRLYDSTWGQWYSSTQKEGHASVIAARGEWGENALLWENRLLNSGEWSVLL
jgi:hypothetical protein